MSTPPPTFWTAQTGKTGCLSLAKQMGGLRIKHITYLIYLLMIERSAFQEVTTDVRRLVTKQYNIDSSIKMQYLKSKEFVWCMFVGVKKI